MYFSFSLLAWLYGWGLLCTFLLYTVAGPSSIRRCRIEEPTLIVILWPLLLLPYLYLRFVSQPQRK